MSYHPDPVPHVVCDQCGRGAAVADADSLPDASWYSFDADHPIANTGFGFVRLPYGIRIDFCCPRCLGAFFRGAVLEYAKSTLRSPLEVAA